MSTTTRGCGSTSGAPTTTSKPSANGWPAQSWRTALHGRRGISTGSRGWMRHGIGAPDGAESRSWRRSACALAVPVAAVAGRGADVLGVAGSTGTTAAELPPKLAPEVGPTAGHAPVIVDARTLPSGTEIETDVCIVGAGPSGVALCRRATPQRNSGVRARERRDERDLAHAVSARRGERRIPVSRLVISAVSAFGGSSHRWGPYWHARPLDAIDFEAREAIPHLRLAFLTRPPRSVLRAGRAVLRSESV